MRISVALLVGLITTAPLAHALETLYLREIVECEPSTIDVRLISDKGRFERRAFKIDGSILRHVIFTDEKSGNTLDLNVDQTFGDAVLLAPASRADVYLEQFRSLFLDFHVYEAFCESSEMQAYRKKHPLPFVFAEPGPAAAFAWLQPVIVAVYGR